MPHENKTQYIKQGGLQVASCLEKLVRENVAAGLDVSADVFWARFEEQARKLIPINRALLEDRARLQSLIDEWHRSHLGAIVDHSAYQTFLTDIGYITPEGEDFEITGDNIDAEISALAGPQLVVPINNARYALNAANARWGSLYDALYGTDVIPEEGGLARSDAYNEARGNAVIAYAKQFLDRHFPLNQGGHSQCVVYQVESGKLIAVLEDGTKAALVDHQQFVGYFSAKGAPARILLLHNGLHIEIIIDRSHPVGKTDKAGVADIHLEAAISTIMDCEDSVAAVSPAEKTEVYANWLGLMRGDLAVTMDKGGRSVTRALNPDRDYISSDGHAISLKGRSLMLVRNVGHLMTTDAVLLDGEQVPEGILDGFVTSFIALHDLRGLGKYRNSTEGSVYIVKPKMHGPEEAAFAAQLFNCIEDALGLARYTLKIGIMDEERRTSVNLKECIRAVKDRVFFINTGFLDRTGDDIHTVMHAGPVVPKGDIKNAEWINAYEQRNVAIGLQCGFMGRAQIGKGMWAMPDEMEKMVKDKVSHPMSGATTAWVPSPTAATLHSLHYHQVDVYRRQAELSGNEPATLNALLSMPLLRRDVLTPDDIRYELENNAQSILGYVVRWVDAGIGCSKVPDINNIGLMEDRATLRISSQHIANWLLHGICSEQDVKEAFERMASVVDQQNDGDKSYTNMAPNIYDSFAFNAAVDLALKGGLQPSGYTEPLLDAYRRRVIRKNMA